VRSGYQRRVLTARHPRRTMQTGALDKPEKYLHRIDMATAKLFQHGGSQAVRLPKDFRFEGTEVEIEKRGDEVVLRPKPKPRLKTLADVARFMHENFP
jgi:antitoxin VapB